ncbi:hypothetical protein JTB14_027641 [Gonioctena quinquepunctata]|nr:hypothetical protein JTB14_027641 [Gonioctena quinquepunctata]
MQLILMSVEEKVIEALKKIDFKPFLNFSRIEIRKLGVLRVGRAPAKVEENKTEVEPNVEATEEGKTEIEESPAPETEEPKVERTEDRINSPRLGAQAYQRNDTSAYKWYKRKRPRNRSPGRSPKVARRSNTSDPPTRGHNIPGHNSRGRGNSQRRTNNPRPQSQSSKDSKPPAEKPPSGIIMLVVPTQYPVSIMTKEQLESAQTELLNAIDKIEDGAFRPQFLDCFKRKGSLTIDCFNQESVEWLKNTAPGLTPWEGAELKVIEPGKVTQMVILPNQYPFTVLAPEQLDTLQTLILKIIDIIPQDSFMPQFLNCTKQRGTLVLDCNNQESVEWLKDAVQNLIAWEGPELNVFEPKDVPVLDMLSMWIPGPPESPEQVLERLERQNKGLRTKEWHFIDQKIEENGQVLMVSVQDSILEVLRNIDFRPFLNFTRIKVKHIGKFKPRAKQQGLKTESAGEGQAEDSKEEDDKVENLDTVHKTEAADQNSEVEVGDQNSGENGVENQGVSNG